MKTASEMTYIVSSGALNSTPTNQLCDKDSRGYSGRDCKRSVDTDAARETAAREVALFSVTLLCTLCLQVTTLVHVASSVSVCGTSLRPVSVSVCVRVCDVSRL